MLRLQHGVTRANASYPAALTPPLSTEAYVYHRGGILRFSKLTMNDADLDIVGDRPQEFSIFQKEYKKQPVTGYSKNTATNGFVARMVDYAHFQSQAATHGDRPKTTLSHIRFCTGSHH